MSRRLRISAEIGDWLTDLRADDEAAAAEVAASMVTLLEAPDLIAGPALRALGGHPDVTAEFDGEQQILI